MFFPSNAIFITSSPTSSFSAKDTAKYTYFTEEKWLPVKLLKRLRTTSVLTGESFKFLMDRNLIFKIISTFKTSKYIAYCYTYSKVVKVC